MMHHPTSIPATLHGDLPVRDALQAAAARLPPNSGVALPTWASGDLLCGAREALIRHEGSTYRLRLTALGKLILTK